MAGWPAASWTVQTEKYLPLSLALSQEIQLLLRLRWDGGSGPTSHVHLFRTLLHVFVCVLLLSLEIFKTGKVWVCTSTQRGGDLQVHNSICSPD